MSLEPPGGGAPQKGAMQPPNESPQMKIDPDSQMARRTFRRPRAGRACGTCHSRRVRCDAGSRGLPCTNCIAFSLECSIPPKIKKKRDGNTAGGLKRGNLRGGRSRQDGTTEASDFPGSFLSDPKDFANLLLEAGRHIKQDPDDTKTYAEFIKPEAISSTIEDSGQVVFLAAPSNMAYLVHDGPAGAVHFPLPKTENSLARRPSQLDEVELNILERRGALCLPPKELCDELVHAFFKWVAPVVPIIDQSSFMQRYGDLTNPPSIFLMQAICLAGSRVCTTPLLMDVNESPIPASTLFYKRAKALYDTHYEQDRVTLLQGLILMGWYWEDPGTVTKNVFYWNGIATTIAHGVGMHRSTKNSKLSPSDKRLWKRIWWTLYSRDRSIAVSLGRPTQINMDDVDVEMICEEDFTDDLTDPLHVQFFIQYVKICGIMELVLMQNYSITSRVRRNNSLSLTQCDMALAEWLQNCPLELRWNQNAYGFWPAFLFCVYQTTSCLLHRAHLPPVPSPPTYTSLSRNPAFQSANMITVAAESIIAHQELRYSPPFMIYALSSALLVHIYELHTIDPPPTPLQRRRVSVCMYALGKVSDVWLVAKMVYDMFENILVSTGFDDCLPHATGYEKQMELEGKMRDLDGWGTADEGDWYALAAAGMLGEGREEREEEERRERRRRLPLTPALRAHLDVILSSLKKASLS